MLGLAGEVGSLLTEVKKTVRDPESPKSLIVERIKEEAGDVLWYAASIARRVGVDFQRDVLLGNLKRIAANEAVHLPLIDGLSASKTELESAILEDLQAVDTFDKYLDLAVTTSKFRNEKMVVVKYLARIWGNLNNLLQLLDKDKTAFGLQEKEQVAKNLGDIVWYVAGFADHYGLSLNDIAQSNVEKTRSMFIPEEERRPTPLFDEPYEELEQFPRRFDVDFVSTNSDTAVMLINGVRVGDPLKDNAYRHEFGNEVPIDGYRFHDCVHLAFVAVLGWSPVLRVRPESL